jgi:hypothetical protein
MLETSLERAQELHRRLRVVDCHHDIAMEIASRHQRGEKGGLSAVWAERLQRRGDRAGAGGKLAARV